MFRRHRGQTHSSAHTPEPAGQTGPERPTPRYEGTHCPGHPTRGRIARLRRQGQPPFKRRLRLRGRAAVRSRTPKESVLLSRRRRLWRWTIEHWVGVAALVVAILVALHTFLGGDTTAALPLHLSALASEGTDGKQRDFATPKVGTELHLKVVAMPRREELGDVTIAVTLPGGVVASGSCRVEIGGKSGTCAGDGRAEATRLESGEEMDLELKVGVERRIEGEESLKVQLTSADLADPEVREISLTAPERTGEREATALISEELLSPMKWEGLLEVPEGTVEEMGGEWRFLTDERIHGVPTVPAGQDVPMRRIFASHEIGAKIITLRAKIETTPLRWHAVDLAGSKDTASKELFALGSDHRAWCSTVRDKQAQPPLRRGERVLIRAAVVGWGTARPHGRPIDAVMLICTAVQSLKQAESGSDTALEGGGLTAPAGPGP